MKKFIKFIIVSFVLLSLPVLANTHNSISNPALSEKSAVKKTEAAETDLKNKQEENFENYSRSKIDRINSDSNYSAKTPMREYNSGNYAMRALSGLSIVLILIFAFAWIYAKFKGINPNAILTGKFSEKDLNRFNILSSSTLGQGKDIHLVEINGKQLVIGSTPNNISLLTEISPEEVENLKTKKQEESIKNKNNSLFSEETAGQTQQEDGGPEKEESVNPDYYFSEQPDVYKEYNNKD